MLNRSDNSDYNYEPHNHSENQETNAEEATLDFDFPTLDFLNQNQPYVLLKNQVLRISDCFPKVRYFPQEKKMVFLMKNSIYFKSFSQNGDKDEEVELSYQDNFEDYDELEIYSEEGRVLIMGLKIYIKFFDRDSRLKKEIGRNQGYGRPKFNNSNPFYITELTLISLNIKNPKFCEKKIYSFYQQTFEQENLLQSKVFRSIHCISSGLRFSRNSRFSIKDGVWVGIVYLTSLTSNCLFKLDIKTNTCLSYPFRLGYAREMLYSEKKFFGFVSDARLDNVLQAGDRADMVLMVGSYSENPARNNELDAFSALRESIGFKPYSDHRVGNSFIIKQKSNGARLMNHDMDFGRETEANNLIYLFLFEFFVEKFLVQFFSFSPQSDSILVNEQYLGGKKGIKMRVMGSRTQKILVQFTMKDYSQIENINYLFLINFRPDKSYLSKLNGLVVFQTQEKYFYLGYDLRTKSITFFQDFEFGVKHS